MTIKGWINTRQVLVDRDELLPDESWKIRNHSPDGFMWGYEGSGPAQLALALIIYAAKKLDIPIMEGVPYYQDLKRDFVAKLPQNNFVEDFDLIGWLQNKLSEKKKST